MNNPIIQLQGLTKRYGKQTAVDGLDLDIHPGEVFGLLGPNGAGKTTTILMMLGLTEPSAGTARVCGINATRQPIEVKRRVGYLPDQVGFYGNMNALENLLFIARLNRIAEAEARERARGLLEVVGLSRVGDKPVGEFSRGMKQRLGLADVLIKEPSVIILDEPTLGIDPRGVNAFLELIQRLSKEQKLTVLLSSHHLQQVQRVCDRVGIFVKGKLITEGSIDHLSRNLSDKEGHTTTITLGEGNTVSTVLESEIRALENIQTCQVEGPRIQVHMQSDRTADLVRMLVEAGLDVIGVQRKRYGLDEIYERYFQHPEASPGNPGTSSGFIKKLFLKN